MPNAKMSESTTGRMYDLWAWCYNRTFGAILRHRLHRAVQQLRLKPGDRVLDLGFGTGLTLDYYPRNITVVGADLSSGMLAKAAQRKRKLGFDSCAIIQTDALTPPFADGSFDHVLICHTLTVVSDPARLLQWAGRLLKPGGEIVLANHFQSNNPVIAWFERALNPLFVAIGWRSDIAFEDIMQRVDLKIAYRFKTRLVDIWQIVVLTHHVPAESQHRRAVPPVSAASAAMTTHPGRGVPADAYAHPQ